MSPPLVWLLDAYVQIFRAHYSVPEASAPDGRPTGAFRGFAPELSELRWRGADRAALEALFEETGVTGLLGRVSRFAD